MGEDGAYRLQEPSFPASHWLGPSCGGSAGRLVGVLPGTPRRTRCVPASPRPPAPPPRALSAPPCARAGAAPRVRAPRRWAREAQAVPEPRGPRSGTSVPGPGPRPGPPHAAAAAKRAAVPTLWPARAARPAIRPAPPSRRGRRVPARRDPEGARRAPPQGHAPRRSPPNHAPWRSRGALESGPWEAAVHLSLVDALGHRLCSCLLNGVKGSLFIVFRFGFISAVCKKYILEVVVQTRDPRHSKWVGCRSSRSSSGTEFWAIQDLIS